MTPNHTVIGERGRSGIAGISNRLTFAEFSSGISSLFKTRTSQRNLGEKTGNLEALGKRLRNDERREREMTKCSDMGRRGFHADRNSSIGRVFERRSVEKIVYKRSYYGRRRAAVVK